jgi:hypothetical protein
VTAATCVIQRYYRGYRGRVRAAYLRRKKAERDAFLKEQELKAKQEAEEHRRKEIERRMHPRTAADFEILYNELEAWRLQVGVLCFIQKRRILWHLPGAHGSFPFTCTFERRPT